MSGNSLRLKSFAVRVHPSMGDVEYVFKDANGAETAVSMPQTAASKFVQGMALRTREALPKMSGIVQAMPVESVKADVATDGTAVLVIGTTNIPEIALSLSPETVTKMRAELERLSDHQGRTPTFQ